MTKNDVDYIGPRGRGGGRRLPPLPGLPAGAGKWGSLALVLLAPIVFFYVTFLEYVAPDEYGIKQVKIGANAGMQKEVYGPGLHFVMAGFQQMHRLPRHVQVLELTQVNDGYDTAAGDFGSVQYDRPAKIQTSDGFYVDVDATILYRIIDPYLVATTLGTGRQFLDQGMLPKAEPFLKQTLGELTTEEFYNSPLRVTQAEAARDKLDAELRPKGLTVDQVLVRYFKYSERIQENIEDKKLQDQLVFTNHSKRLVAEEEQKLQRVTTEGAMQVTITLQEGDAYKVQKDAEKELYVRRQEAQADLLVELAEAEGTRLRNEAMQVLGSDRLVAMRMAEVLNGLEAIIVPSAGENSMNPLDLNAVLETFGMGATPLAAGESPAPLAPIFQARPSAPAPDTDAPPNPNAEAPAPEAPAPEAPAPEAPAPEAPAKETPEVESAQ